MKDQIKAGTKITVRSVGAEASKAETDVKVEISTESSVLPEESVSEVLDPYADLTTGGSILLNEDRAILPSSRSAVFGTVGQVQITTDTMLNLNGKTLHFDSSGIANMLSFTPALLEVQDGASLTLNGTGTLNADLGENPTAAVCLNGGNLTITDGSYYGADSVLSILSGNLTIEGGFFDIPSSVKEKQKQEGTSQRPNLIDVLASSDPSLTANVRIQSGTFVNFNPSRYANSDGSSWIRAGFAVQSETKENGEIWYTGIPQAN